MPDDIAAALALYLEALQASAAAEAASEQAQADLAAAEEAYGLAQVDAANTADQERRARAAYVAALRAHGYHDTASGPAPDAPQFLDPGDAAAIYGATRPSEGDYLYTIICCDRDIHIHAGIETACNNCGSLFLAPMPPASAAL